MNQSNPSSFRIVTYNILLGGMGRLDPIYETFLYLNPDLVAMTECDDPDAVAYLANKLNLEYALAEAPNSPHHIAILSKHPIGQMINLAPSCPSLTHGALEAVIDTPNNPLHLIAAHLPYGLTAQHEQTRLEQLNQILNNTPNANTAILLGTLNAHAPYHNFDPANLPPDTTAPTTLPTDLINQITQSGHVDALHQILPNNTQHTFSTGYPALTPDYIFLPPNLAKNLTAAHIETGGFAPYCSDHYPVCCDIKLD